MNHKFWILAIFVMSVNAFASTGGVDGGGGKAVVCRDSQGQILSAQSFDLYEGSVMFGLLPKFFEEGLEVAVSLSPKAAIDPWEKRAASALANIPSSKLQQMISHRMSLVQKSMRLVPANSQLLPVDDSFEVIAPKNCFIEQAANYFNDRLILVSEEIWNAFDETSKAALMVHEAIYALNRMQGAKDSRISRKMVATLFDGQTQLEDFEDGLPADKLQCAASNDRFWAFPSTRWGMNGWTLQFESLGGHLVLSKKTAFLPTTGMKFHTSSLEQRIDKIGTSLAFFLNSTSRFEDGDPIKVTESWEAPQDIRGQVVPGFQFARYYLEWSSSTFPMSSKSAFYCFK